MESAHFTDGKGRSLFKRKRIFRILVADDQALIADTLALISRGNDFNTAAVYSGEQAVPAAITFKPDQFISDVNLTSTYNCIFL